MPFTIYHNPRCRKSRIGLEYLRQKGVEPLIRHYLTDPLTLAELEKLLAKLNMPASQMVRTQEALYKKELKGRHFSENDWVRILVQHPNLLKRPLIVRGNKAVWADPVENIQLLIK